MLLQQIEGLLVSQGGGIVLLFYRNVTLVAQPFSEISGSTLLIMKLLHTHFLIDGLDGVGKYCARWSILDVALISIHDNKSKIVNIPIKIPILPCVPTSPGKFSEEHHL